MKCSNTTNDGANMKWSEYVDSLSSKYGSLTKLIWISKKRKKYILEFAYTRTLIINDVVYDFKDILSCKIEKGLNSAKEAEDEASDPNILLIGVNDKTNMLLSLTVWSNTATKRIDKMMQEIIHSNKVCNE